MIKIVREPSDTPNIQNTDDFVGLRYSYGDYNGYVDNKGQMLAYQINGSTFKVLSGRAVVNGVEVDIDANGASITIDNISQTQAHSLYIRVNLATMKADLFDVIGDDLPTSDDLTANTIGMAYLLLYTFNSTAGVISNVVKKVERVVGLREVVSGITPVAEAEHADKATIAEKTDFSKEKWTYTAITANLIGADKTGVYEIVPYKLVGSVSYYYHGFINLSKLNTTIEDMQSMSSIIDMGISSGQLTFTQVEAFYSSSGLQLSVVEYHLNLTNGNFNFGTKTNLSFYYRRIR